MLDKELEKMLRLKQAKLIQKDKRHASFSRVINEVLKKGLEEDLKEEIKQVVNLKVI